ncbi:hypothetical protein PR048_014303 [Dryococelus australis]|uniref:DDE Tnp4 domain-containing protein n=1 Tax=Dryococelus australis TaxID=614101 RepID=A0ABQ9HDU0_9NEOP|nr:hypothetical protein PR048_014303 [Dryococelus australis]
MNMHTLERKHRRRRRWWTRGWIAAGRASAATFIDYELRNKYPDDFRNVLHISEMHVDDLLERINRHITKTDTNMRQTVTAKLKVEVTLRYFATGDVFKSSEIIFRVPKSTIGQFLPDTCTAVHKSLEEFIKYPRQCRVGRILNMVEFPRLHWSIRGAPGNCGSDYLNYKDRHSIILLTLADSDYCFTYIDVEAKGRSSDGGVFSNSSPASSLNTNSLGIPKDAVIVGDDACSLKPYLMKPYCRRNMSKKQAIFNYRLSRAWRVSENADFECLKMDKVASACCVLYNWLKKANPAYIFTGLLDNEDNNPTYHPGTRSRLQMNGVENLQPTRNSHPSSEAMRIRVIHCVIISMGKGVWHGKSLRLHNGGEAVSGQRARRGRGKEQGCTLASFVRQTTPSRHGASDFPLPPLFSATSKTRMDGQRNRKNPEKIRWPVSSIDYPRENVRQRTRPDSDLLRLVGRRALYPLSHHCPSLKVSVARADRIGGARVVDELSCSGMNIALVAARSLGTARDLRTRWDHGSLGAATIRDSLSSQVVDRESPGPGVSGNNQIPAREPTGRCERAVIVDVGILGSWRSASPGGCPTFKAGRGISSDPHCWIQRAADCGCVMKGLECIGPWKHPDVSLYSWASGFATTIGRPRISRVSQTDGLFRRMGMGWIPE